MSQQDYKPNSVSAFAVSDYLSVLDIAVGIKRTTLLLWQA